MAGFLKLIHLQATGKDPEGELIPQKVLRGVVFIGEVGWKEGASPVPDSFSIGIADASTLDDDLKDWP